MKTLGTLFIILFLIAPIISACSSDTQTAVTKSESSHAPGIENPAPEEEMASDSNGDNNTDLEYDIIAENEGNPDEDRSWKSAYREFLLDSEIKYGLDPYILSYAMIYVNDDDIQELFFYDKDYHYEENYFGFVITYDEAADKAVEPDWGKRWYGLSYLERGNLLYDSCGQTGWFWDTVYSIENGKWVEKGGGFYDDTVGGKEDVYRVEYFWGDTETVVSEEEYRKRLCALLKPDEDRGTWYAAFPAEEGFFASKIFDYGSVKEITGYMNGKEMMAFLRR